MKTDELGRALTDLAGTDPPLDDAWRRVSRRARRERTRTRVGIAAIGSLLVAGAVVGASQLHTKDHHVTVVSPTTTTPRRVDQLTWTRVAAPAMTITRIVTANGQTFAVGSSPDRRASIAEYHRDGSISSVDPTAAYDMPRTSGRVNDLVGIPGALIAVGQSAQDKDATWTPEVWRSTDGGQSWQGVPVETPAQPYSVIGRVVVAHGAVFAIGDYDRSNIDPIGLPCPVPVWRSDDGTDFRLTSAPATCRGDLRGADGPAGVLVTVGGDATAWHRSGTEWIPRSISGGAENSTVVEVAGDEHGYVAVGSVGPGPHDFNQSTGAIWWSTDGNLWSRVVTANAPADQVERRAVIADVVHTAAGWVAVGWQTHPDDPTKTDTTVWTSLDGEHWSRIERDNGVFEQYTRPARVGAIADGFAIVGTANLSGEGITGDPLHQDNVLWLGSTEPPTHPTGILEGTMIEVGGPGPGLNRRIAGSVTATASDGRDFTATVTADGRFSTQLPPGTYNIVGHSPLLGNGKYDCAADGPAHVRANAVAHAALVCQIR